MSASRLSKFSFAAGMLTAFAIAGAALFYMERRVGLRHLWADVSPFNSPHADVPPEELHAELIALGAVPDNVPELAPQDEHSSFMVQRDEALEYVLRPGASADAYMLRSRRDFNIDPPVFYFPAGVRMSETLRAYLDASTRVRYSMSVNADGFRTTVPDVPAPRRVLLVGDSVAFGLGVDDEWTMASRLQQRVGGDLRIVNAGVAGYDGTQIVRAARRHLGAAPFDALIVVANMNDFAKDNDSLAQTQARAEGILDDVAALKPMAAGRVIVYFHGDLEVALRHLLDADIHGWTGPWVRHFGALRQRLPELTASRGLSYVDGLKAVDDSVQALGTIFSPFAFYVDHAHLSRQGNEAAADALFVALQAAGVARP